LADFEKEFANRRRGSTTGARMNTSLKDKWIFITGASAGFGAEGARHFAREGANLILGARRVARLESIATECKKDGAASAHFHELDVASTESVNAFVDWLKTLTPKLDVLVNNAGGAHGMDTVAEGKDADWEAMVQSNFLGLMRVTRACLPLMVENAGSTIINIGSIAGRVAYEYGSVYCGVKAAEKSITQTLRLELNGTGVRVGTLDPGLALTEFSMVRFKGDAEKAGKAYEGLDPLVAEDIAEAMIWMATRPPHVCIDEILIKCTAQAAIHKTHRVTD
jgi:NADP-dependent 3-hydroxy acid dehydrogenase YdfG